MCHVGARECAGMCHVVARERSKTSENVPEPAGICRNVPTAQMCKTNPLVYSVAAGLELRGDEAGEFGSLALGERDVADDGLSLQSLDDVREPVTAAVEVRVIDLRRVAGEDELRAFADARRDRLDLVGG